MTKKTADETVTWVHKKRGGRYEVLTSSAGLQWSGNREAEESIGCLTVYRSLSTGKYYVRPTVEFLDGRFEKKGWR